MRNLYLLILATASAFAAPKSADLLMTDITHYEKTATALGLKDAKVSYNVPAISYFAIRPDYLFIASLKVLPKQHIGSTALGNTPISLEKKGWKYEIGAAYKFYLNEDLFIAPALLFSDYRSKLFQTVGTTTSQSYNHDRDLRLYGLLGYKITKSAMMFLSVELENDLFSNNYSDDYSQYPVNVNIYQFLSKKWFVYAKYQQTLRDKEARSDSTGNKDSIAYGFGIGMTF